MASSARRPRPPSDPVRQQLVEVRRGLFRLHKALIDAERAALEAERGTLSNGAFLQALIGDPALAWLQPFTALLSEIDEALADREGISRDRARAYVRQVRAMVEPLEDAGEEGRYQRVRDRDPGVLLAHVELNQRLRAAEQEPPTG